MSTSGVLVGKHKAIQVSHDSCSRRPGCGISDSGHGSGSARTDWLRKDAKAWWETPPLLREKLGDLATRARFETLTRLHCHKGDGDMFCGVRVLCL